LRDFTFVLLLPALTTWYGGGDIAITLSRCVCVCVSVGVYFSKRKRKPWSEWLETWQV